VTRAFRSLAGCSALMTGAGWSFLTWTLFSLMFRLLMSFTARARLTPTVFGARMFVVTRLRMPI
jgi:hypothetical protein